MNNNKISYLAIFAAVITGFGLGSFATPVFASSDQAALESIDGYLEECIKELEAGNAEGGLSQCQLADDELDGLLGNSTG